MKKGLFTQELRNTLDTIDTMSLPAGPVEHMHAQEPRSEAFSQPAIEPSHPCRVFPSVQEPDVHIRTASYFDLHPIHPEHCGVHRPETGMHVSAAASDGAQIKQAVAPSQGEQSSSSAESQEPSHAPFHAKPLLPVGEGPALSSPTEHMHPKEPQDIVAPSMPQDCLTHQSVVPEHAMQKARENQDYPNNKNPECGKLANPSHVPFHAMPHLPRDEGPTQTLSTTTAHSANNTSKRKTESTHQETIYNNAGG